jgi:hypothetical protein
MVEGLAANDATLVASEGIFLTPPDLRSNTQRIWIPKTSLDGLEVVAVVGAAKRKPSPEARGEAAATPEQEELF